MSTLVTKEFIIPAKYYQGEYYLMFLYDKERWDKEVQQYHESFKNKLERSLVG